jgi:arylformamidase
MEIFDISVPLTKNMPVWPGDPQITIRQLSSIQRGDESNVSQVRMSVHTGTHIDAPKHFIESGKTIDQIPLHRLIGDVLVMEMKEKVNVITSEALASHPLFEEINHFHKILLRTRNSQLWHKSVPEFQKDFVGIDSSGAALLSEFDLDLIGVDYLSVAPYYDTSKPHQILLSSDIILLEGIDLSEVSSGIYYLWCLPLNIYGIEGAPARAILTR